jgi:uncharacterized DUF497 family protein
MALSPLNSPRILLLRFVMPTWDESKRRRNIRIVLVHADREGDMHVISLRKAERYETRYYLEAAKDSLGEDD